MKDVMELFDTCDENTVKMAFMEGIILGILKSASPTSWAGNLERVLVELVIPKEVKEYLDSLPENLPYGQATIESTVFTNLVLEGLRRSANRLLAEPEDLDDRSKMAAAIYLMVEKGIMESKK